MPSVGDLRATLTLDGRQYATLLKKHKTATKDFGDTFSKMSGKLKAAAGFATAALAASGLAVGLARATERMGETAKAAQRLGGSVGFISEMEFAARSFGVQTDRLHDTMKDLSERIADAAGGATSYEEALNRIGLSGQQLLHLSLEDQFTLVSEGIAGLNTQAEKAFISMELMADAGFELIPMFDAGKERIAEMREEARLLGLGLSKMDVARIRELRASFAKLDLAADGFFNRVAIATADPLQGFAEVLSEQLGMWSEGEAAVIAFGDVAQPILGGIANIVQSIGIAINRTSKAMALGEFAAKSLSGATEEELLRIAEKIETLDKAFTENTALSAATMLKQKLDELKALRNAQGSTQGDTKPTGGTPGDGAFVGKAELENSLALLRQKGMERLELLAHQRDEEIALAKQGFEKGLLSEMEYYRLRADARERFLEQERASREASRMAEEERQRQIAEARRSAAEGRLMALSEFGIQEQEQINLQHQLQMDQLRQHLQNRLITKQEFAMAEAELERRKAEMIAKISQKAQTSQVQQVAQGGQQILGASQQLGNALLKNTKGFQSGIAVANTAAGVTAALATQNWAAAAATVLAGTAQIATISKARRGGGATPGVFSSGGSASSQPATSQDSGPGGGGRGPGRLRIEVTGAASALPPEMVASVAEQIFEYIEDGGGRR